MLANSSDNFGQTPIDVALKNENYYLIEQYILDPNTDFESLKEIVPENQDPKEWFMKKIGIVN